PRAAGSRRLRLAAQHLRHPAGLLRRHFHAVDHALWHARRGARCSAQGGDRTGTGGHWPAHRPLAPHDVRCTVGKRRGADRRVCRVWQGESMNADDRKSMMEAAFAACYGAAPSIWTRAPGRVDLMGSHTDYNHGFILTMTIDRDTWIAARPRTDRTVRVRSLDMGGESIFSLDAITFDGELRWANYV